MTANVVTSGGLTDAELRASPIPVSGTVTATGPLTDTQLRATAVPVSGTVTATGPLTDTQLRASPVPVSGTVTATGPLTDTQLRATAVPVSGTVTATGPLTDTQLRATAVPVSALVLPFQATPTDRSNTITSGGNAQTLAAANASRRYLIVQNQSAGDLYISFTTTAAAAVTSIKLVPGASYENPSHFCPVSAVSIFGATTAQAFHAEEA